MTYFDFNDANDQNSFDLIPKGTLVRVRLSIRPGGFDDAAQGWDGGYATRNANTGSVYLNCEFVVLEGEYARRKLWSLDRPLQPQGSRLGQHGTDLHQGDAQLRTRPASGGYEPADAERAAHRRLRRSRWPRVPRQGRLGEGSERPGQGGHQAGDPARSPGLRGADGRCTRALLSSTVPSTTPSAPSTAPTAALPRAVRRSPAARAGRSKGAPS